jgi:membrane protein YdbS with pleckstrin-like domain
LDNEPLSKRREAMKKKVQGLPEKLMESTATNWLLLYAVGYVVVYVFNSPQQILLLVVDVIVVFRFIGGVLKV